MGLCTRGGTFLPVPGRASESPGRQRRARDRGEPRDHGRAGRPTAAGGNRLLPSRGPGHPGRTRLPGTRRGAASLRRRPARAQARSVTPCRTSCPGRRRWRRAVVRAPSRGRPCGATEAAPAGGGSEAIPTRPPPCGEGHTAAGSRSPAGSPSSAAGLAGPCGRVRLVPARAWVMSAGVAPEAVMPVPGPCGTRGVAAGVPVCS